MSPEATTLVDAHPPVQEVPPHALAGGGIGLMLVLAAVGAAFLSPRRPTQRFVEPAAPAVAPPITAEPETVPGANQRRHSPTPTERETPVAAPAEEARGGVVARLRAALTRSREALQGRFDTLFGKPIDDALFDELEETLLQADVGFETTERITNRVRAAAKGDDADAPALRAAMRDEMNRILADVAQPFATPGDDPLVVLVVGVNGSGKTTTIGKLASRFMADGHSVLLAAADTYRAAAVEQLKVWSDRTGADFVSHAEGADPGAVVYDALEAAKARDRDVVIVDTAGRLQTAKPLMEQLSKLRRVVQKHVSDGPHETLLVLDGTMGQNGLSQARIFNEATPLSGVVVTKLDGTAKGGMVLTIASELALPVKFIGIGEGIDDLRPFDAGAFVEALA